MTTDDWYAKNIQDTLKQLTVTEQGLTTTEALTRLQKYGHNVLPPAHKNSTLQRFAQQFHNLLIYILLVAALVTALLDHWIDFSVIIAVVFINAVIGFIQEGKAEKALDAISQMLSHQASILRDGRIMSLPADSIVPGDIVSLQSGDKVPADLRLLKSRELRIDESMLTGESLPSEKKADTCTPGAAIGDRYCMAYSGTLVTYGTATGVVVGTAGYTEIGQISELLKQVNVLETPLLKRISEFARWLTVAILVITSVMFSYGMFVQGYTATDMFMAAVGLAVAAIPEGLPAIITITLAIGVQAMAQRQAIIRRLPAVETLGSVTTICSDKTGTLTCNEMTVQSVSLADGVYEVSGVGYAPTGRISREGNELKMDKQHNLHELARAAMLCNDAKLHLSEGQWSLQGDPTEGALITLALKAGLDHEIEQGQQPRIDVIPFESEHRLMATLHHDHQGHYFMFVKGAPERILELCTSQNTLEGNTSLNREYWDQQMQQMASKGQRVLAIASKDMPSHQSLNFSDTNELQLLGLVGMIDPPRETVTGSIQACYQAGIQVKMITGDHAATAVAIGQQLGIGDGKSVLTGNDIDTLSDLELAAKVDDIHIFARTSPQHKLRLVSILQSRGDIVAMTGDGVNDAPALKRADVGVAMGMKGTSVARETAEMVLVDDNFSSIVNAVEEGRTVYDNIKKSILFILPTNGGEALTILAAILLGRLLPITPAQILWVNMITAVTLALALAFEPSEKNVMHRPPRDPDEPLLTGFLIWRVIFVAIILVIGTFGLFILERDSGASIEYSRTVAVNMLVTFEIFYLFNARYIYDHAFRKEAFLGNRYALYAVALLIVFQMMFTYLGPLQTLFGTEAINMDSWIRIILAGSCVFFLVEAEKFVFRNLLKVDQQNGPE